MHAEIEKEKSTINDLIQRAKNINHQLTRLSIDLEDKRVEVSI